MATVFSCHFILKYSDTQPYYAMHDIELLTIYSAILHTPNFLEGPGQQRQLYLISEFTSDIRYLKGEHNLIADVLSRPSTSAVMPCPTCEDFIREQKKCAS